MTTAGRIFPAALLAGSMYFGALNAAFAGAFLVCYLPPDAGNRLIRFCPGLSGATAGQPCECLLRTETLAGTMTRLSLPDTGAGDGTPRTMCVPRTQPGVGVTLCPAFRSGGDAGCACDGGAAPGETYTVTMIPRIPKRTNQTAAADLLKRLQECCVSR